jgi:hypothetical protein
LTSRIYVILIYCSFCIITNLSCCLNWNWN